jgi:hypothetical protein
VKSRQLERAQLQNELDVLPIFGAVKAAGFFAAQFALPG